MWRGNLSRDVTLRRQEGQMKEMPVLWKEEFNDKKFLYFLTYECCGEYFEE